MTVQGVKVAKCGKKRLLQTTDKNTERKVEYSEEETSLPCVYAMLYDEGYEYALLTGEKQITYISTSFIDKENVKFSEDYLPYDFMTEEGREIIDDCAQWSYEPGTYEAEETIYDDLKGMEYKAMEADRERNMVIL